MVTDPVDTSLFAPSPAPRSCTIYYVYADRDEELLVALEQHLRPLERAGLLSGWHRRKLLAGEDWQTVVDQHFERADIILLLVTPDLLDSKYCYDTEVERAMLRHQKGEVVVVPVLGRPCMWELAPFERCKPLPRNADPVTRWDDRDEAWKDVAEGLEELIQELRGTRPRSAPAAEHLPMVMERFAVREGVDRLEMLLSALPAASGDPVKEKELRAEIAALDQFIRPLLMPRAGAEMGKMELIEPIGSGAFATVWKSKPPGLDTGERFATKVLHATCLTSGSMLLRFRRGVKAMKYLTKKKDVHPQIVPLLLEDDSSLAFTMPYLPGQNLVNIKGRGWSVHKKVEVLISICHAVEYAHRRGVVHRDIKPANIVLDAAGTPILTDFDIADMDYATTVSMDERGLGSPMFAAPEQLESSEEADVRVDVYSLGRLLHYLLVERPIKVTPEHEDDFRDLAPFPMSLVSIVRRATRRSPERRHRDVAALRAALEMYRSPWFTLSAWVDTMGTRLRPMVAALSLILLALGTIGAFLLREDYHATQYRELARKLDILDAAYDDLAARRASYADEKRQLQARMEALVQQFFAIVEDEKSSAAAKAQLNEEIFKLWKKARDRHDEIAVKEAGLDEESRAQKASIDELRKQLEDQWKHRLTPIARRRLDPPRVRPTSHEEPPPGEAAPDAGGPPKPLKFPDLMPRLTEAKQQAGRCRVPAGAEKKALVKLVVQPSGEVRAEMVSGPRSEEQCVLGPFSGLRVQPYEGSRAEISLNVDLKSSASP
ncbi:MAG: protein kinase [Minicystis sp.]